MMKAIALPMLLFFLVCKLSFAQTVILDDFEAGLGRFNSHVGHGGTTGVVHTSPQLDPTTEPHNGILCLRIALIDNDTSDADWHVRFWSANGMPENNIKLDSIGYIGFWLKTNATYLKTGVTLDAPDTPLGTEKSDSLDVIGDGKWHLYEWNLEDLSQWNIWGGPATNGKLEKPITLDAVCFYASNSDGNADTAIVWLDLVGYNPGGNISDVQGEYSIPDDFSLIGNYPNPFNPTTNIIYSIPYESSVDLKIFDIMGREVRSYNINAQSPGTQNIIWDGKNSLGENVTSGIYLYRLILNSLVNQERFEIASKMLLLK